MRILVSGATSTVARLQHTELGNHLGVLHTAQNGNRMAINDLPWALDNSAFSNPDDTKFWNRAIDVWDLMTYHPPIWIAVPDVVGDHAATLDRFYGWLDTWQCELDYIPFPLAFVLQNGATVDSIPWELIAAVFVGGDDVFKLKDCHDLVDAAKAMGKLVHIGRVNTLSRIEYAFDIGADTVDGSGFSMFAESNLERALRRIQTLTVSPRLFA